MKHWVMGVLIVVASSGCQYGQAGVGSLVENPPAILIDPSSKESQTRLDRVERRYLRGEITYAEYVDEKQEIERDYAREVSRREAIIEGP